MREAENRGKHRAEEVKRGIKKLDRPKDMSIIVIYFEMVLHPERHSILSVSTSTLRRHLNHYVTKLPEARCFATVLIHLTLVNCVNKVDYYHDCIFFLQGRKWLTKSDIVLDT